jgi:hypothetical protein
MLLKETQAEFSESTSLLSRRTALISIVLMPGRRHNGACSVEIKKLPGLFKGL